MVPMSSSDDSWVNHSWKNRAGDSLCNQEEILSRGVLSLVNSSLPGAFVILYPAAETGDWELPGASPEGWASRHGDALVQGQQSSLPPSL